MSWRLAVSLFSITLFLSSCIGDDIVTDEVDPIVRILNPVDSIEINTTYSYEAAAFDNTGLRTNDPELRWTSTDPAILEIDALTGMAMAKQLGTCMVEVEWISGSDTSRDNNIVTVGNSTVQQSITRTGSLRTTSSYLLRGDFNLEENNGVLTLSLESNYAASSSLPGLYVYLTNNPATTSGALEVGPAISFSGAHTYTLPPGTGLNEYQYVLYFCKPFNVKVGDGKFDN